MGTPTHESPDRDGEKIRGPSNPSSRKKPYRKPALTEYGSVRKLTRGGSLNINPDGASGMGMA